MRKEVSRRDFVKTAVKAASVVGLYSLVESSSEIKQFFGLNDYQFFAGDSLETILLKAPKARFYVAFAPSSDCSLCHGTKIPKGDLKKAHKNGIVKCLLCAHAYMELASMI